MNYNQKEATQKTKKSIKRHPIIALCIIAIFIVLIVIIASSNNKPSNSVQEQQQPSPEPKLGDTAYLRLPNITDPEQVICLGSTKEDFDKIITALHAKDYIGILEIPGAFCVSNGTKVQVIDTGVGIRKVRIMEGVREVDKDKIFLSGWTAKEWVVSQ